MCCVKILENLTKYGPSHSKALVDAEILEPLVTLLASSNGDVVLAAVGTLAKIIKNDPELLGCVVEAGAIAPLLELVQPSSKVYFILHFITA